MLFEVLFAYVVKAMVDVVGLDIGVEDVYEGFAAFAIAYHEADHGVDEFVDEAFFLF